MPLPPLAITAITNFILACEGFFLAGSLFAQLKARRSAAWFWQFVVLMVALSALIGGIDHGFLETSNQMDARRVFQRLNWLAIGVLTLLIFLTTARQFLKPPARRIAFIIAGAQLVVFVAALWFIDDYRIVILNYVPVILWLLVQNILNLNTGKGSLLMITGIVISLAASGIQAARVDVFTPLDHNGLYHVGMMIALVFFYRASHLLDA